MQQEGSLIIAPSSQIAHGNAVAKKANAVYFVLIGV